MARIGMIGGFGPESTLDYYRLLIETHRQEVQDGSNPEIVIYSMDVNKLLNMIANKQWDATVEWLVEGLKVLDKAGADFGFISANTPHIVFDRVKELSPIPLLSIVEETCKSVEKLGIKKVGLLGTLFTMQSDFYQKVFNNKGIQIFIPNEEEQQYIQTKLMTEIELGSFLDETREGLLGIAKRMIEDNSIEGLILGCTELPLILTGDEFGIPFFNTSKIHVESVIQYYKMNKHLIEFDKMDWEANGDGVRYKAYIRGNQKIRLLEFSEGFEEKGWCTKGHAGYVLDGEFSCDFNGRNEQYKKGDVFFIGAGEAEKHKAVLGEGEKALLLMFEII